MRARQLEVWTTRRGVHSLTVNDSSATMAAYAIARVAHIIVIEAAVASQRPTGCKMAPTTIRSTEDRHMGSTLTLDRDACIGRVRTTLG
jgi:hypothetical protein